MRVVEDYDVDRRQVEAWRHAQPSRTNHPKAFLPRFCARTREEKKLKRKETHETRRKRRCVSKPDCVLSRTPGCDLESGVPLRRSARSRHMASRHHWRVPRGRCTMYNAERRMQNAECRIDLPRDYGLEPERHPGDDSVRVPPLPIPNREVKPHHADGTAKVGE